MSEIRVATRYAKAIFDLAGEKKNLEDIVDNARSFVALCESNHDFDNLLKSPIVSIEKKQAIIEKLFGRNFDEVTMGFIRIVLRKNREPLLKRIFQQVIEMYKEHKGIISVTVFTAVPIANSIKKDIQKFLEKETHSEVELKEKVDENMIGGFLLQFEDKLIDASVASQLKALRKHLINNN